MSTLNLIFLFLSLATIASFAIHLIFFVALDVVSWFPELFISRRARKIVGLLTNLKNKICEFAVFLMLLTALVLPFMLWDNYSFVFLEHP